MPDVHCPTCQDTVTVQGDGTCIQCGTPLIEAWSSNPEEVE